MPKKRKKMAKNGKKSLKNTILFFAKNWDNFWHKIIVLNDGEIVGEGTHKELMQTCKVYQEIAYSQLSKEELDKWAVQVEKCQILQKTKM